MSLNTSGIAPNFIHPNQSWTSKESEAQQDPPSSIPRIHAVSSRSIPKVSTQRAFSNNWEMGDFTFTNGSFQNNSLDVPSNSASGGSASQQQTGAKANRFIQDQLPSIVTTQNVRDHSRNTTSSSLASSGQIQNARSIFFEKMVTNFSAKLDAICSDNTAQFGDLKDQVVLAFKGLLCSFAHTVRKSDRQSMIKDQIDEAIDLSLDAVEILASKTGTVLSPQEKISEEIRIKSQMQDREFVQLAAGTALETLLDLGQEAISHLPFPSLPNNAPSSSSAPTSDPFFDDQLNMICSSSSDPVTTSQAPFPEVRSMAPSCSSGPVPTYPSEENPNNDLETQTNREETASKRPQRKYAKDKVYSVLSDSESDEASALITSNSSKNSISKKRKRVPHISSESEDSVDKETAAASSSQPSSNKKIRYTPHEPITIILEQGPRKPNLSFHFKNPPQELTSLITKIDTKKNQIGLDLDAPRITAMKSKIRDFLIDSIKAFQEEDSDILPSDMIEYIRYAGSTFDLLTEKQTVHIKKTFINLLEELEKPEESLIEEAFVEKIGDREYNQLKKAFKTSKTAVKTLKQKPLKKYVIKQHEIPDDLNFSESTSFYFSHPYTTLSKYAKKLSNLGVYSSEYKIRQIKLALKLFLENIQSVPIHCEDSLAEEITAFLTYAKKVYMLYEKLRNGNSREIKNRIKKAFTKILERYEGSLISRIGIKRYTRLRAV